MSRGRIGPEKKEEIGKSAHYGAVVCTWSIMTTPVLIERCAVSTFDLRVGHELISLETSCQNNDIRGLETISSDHTIWCNLKNPRVGEKQFFIVQGFEISAVEDPSLSTTTLVSRVLNLKMDDHFSYLATDIEIGNKKIMVLGWCGLAHVRFGPSSLQLTQEGCQLVHGEEKKVALRNQEDMKPMQPHSKREIAQNPLQDGRICKIVGWEYPVFAADNLGQGFGAVDN